jgi:glyoxylase-like metal-dependent hydrolase (beta-lactamase superfamily II)
MTRFVRAIVCLVLPAALALGCSASSIPTRPAGLAAGAPAGAPLREEEVRVRLERVVAARWSVPLSGLLDLDHEDAVAAGLEDREEAIEIAVFVVDHPQFGRYLIDSGVADAFRRGPGAAGVSRVVSWAMGADRLEVLASTDALGAGPDGPVRGVFLTHMHLDHVMGLPDVGADVPVFVGPGEATARRFEHLATRGTIDRLVGPERVLRSWSLGDDPDGRFEGRVDVFGDGSLIGLHVPGHTPGSMAFLVRAEDGEHLVVGDASHTAWGWMHGVPPGTYTMEAERGVESLHRLRAFAAERPALRVHPGHQPLPANAGARSVAGAVGSAAGE